MEVEVIIDSSEEEASLIDIQFVKKIFNIIIDIIKKKNISKDYTIDKALNIIFVDSNTIKNLNNNYRNINKVTDVLSFFYDDEELNLWGELCINPKQLKKQALRYEVSFEEELIRLITHGILHLLGYDHKTDKQRKEMFSLQEEIIAMTEVKIKDGLY